MAYGWKRLVARDERGPAAARGVPLCCLGGPSGKSKSGSCSALPCLRGGPRDGAGAHDRTRYGTARSSTKSFEAHHTQRISKAAVIYDAMAIRKQTTSLKQRVFGCAAQAAAGEGEA